MRIFVLVLLPVAALGAALYLGLVDLSIADGKGASPWMGLLEKIFGAR
ncbi:MAG: hypothetical protein AAF568_00255 [Pseudomonadota bacterium]